MKRSLFYISALFLLGVISCKKNALPPETPSEEPVFYAQLAIGGAETRTLDASSNYYMNATYSQDPNGVYVFAGELKQMNCGMCGYSIEFRINDDSVSAIDAEMQPNRALKLGLHEFNDINMAPLGYNGTFKSGYPTSLWIYDWFRDNSQVPESGLGVHTYTSFFTPGSHTVALQCTRPTGTNITAPILQNTYIVGNSLQVNFIATRVPPLGDYNFQFTPTTTVTGPNLIYFWDYDDGTTEYSGGSEHHYTVTIPQPNYYKFAKLVTTAAGQTCVTNYQVPIIYDPYPVHSNFTSTFTPVPNSMGLGAASIVITDPAGNKYSSAAFDQASGTKFEIVSVEDYKKNDAGNNTKKVKINFNCKVKDANGTPKEISGSAVIAVAYKP